MKAKGPPLPDIPDIVRLSVERDGGRVVLLLPNTEANRAKQLGPVPFDMLHEAQLTVTREVKQ